MSWIIGYVGPVFGFRGAAECVGGVSGGTHCEWRPSYPWALGHTVYEYSLEQPSAPIRSSYLSLGGGLRYGTVKCCLGKHPLPPLSGISSRFVK